MIAGREQARTLTRNSNERNIRVSNPEQVENLAIVPKNITNKAGLPIITVDHATDFTLGGALGLAVKKLIARRIEVSRLNNNLSSTVQKLRQLEEDDLPGIKNVLQDYAIKEGIQVSDDSSDLVDSISALVDAIVTHADIHRKAVQPFITELQALRRTLIEPLTQKLLNSTTDGTSSKAIETAIAEVLKGEYLKTHLETAIAEALVDGGFGERIRQTVIDSLEGKDLIGEAGLISLREAVRNAFESDNIFERLSEGVQEAVGNSDLAEGLVEALADKVVGSEIKDDDPSLAALRTALSSAFESDGVAGVLYDGVQDAIRETDLEQRLIKALADKIISGGIKDDDPSLAALRTALSDAFQSDGVAGVLYDRVQDAIGEVDLAETIVQGLVKKLKIE